MFGIVLHLLPAHTGVLKQIGMVPTGNIDNL